MSILSEPLDPAKLAALLPRFAPFGGTVRNLRRLSGGASQETWAFDVVGGGEVIPLILRRAPGGSYQHETAVGLEMEAAVITAVAAHQVPVPAVQYILEPADGLGRGFLTAHVDGETIARKILRDDDYAGVRPRLAGEFGAILAAIHAVPTSDLPPLRAVHAADALALYRRGTNELATPRSVFQLALRWLQDRMPVPASSTLIHGDFRLGNLIIGPDRVRAVLDWELTHLGDPMEDLAWLCTTPWRFGNVDRPVAGIAGREALFEEYEAAGGLVDRDRVRWWEVLSSLRWGVNCASMTALFRDGTDPSVERAMIARRASENEIDLLRLIYLGD